MELQSENINEISLALAKAQSEMTFACKTSVNPFYKSKYADLSSVWDACRDPLTKNGLAVLQQIQVIENKTFLITTMVHGSGQWFKSVAPVVPNKDDIQALGVAITYMRRYCLSAIVGITQDDDDAEGAMERKEKSISKDQFNELDNLLAYCSPEYQTKFNERLASKKISSLKFLPASEFLVTRDSFIKKSQEYQNLISNMEAANGTENS